MLFSAVPTCAIYDPAFAYELAVIVQDGIRRMYQEKEDRFYYLTVYNENYAQPAMPEGDHIREGILRGLYKYKASDSGYAAAQPFRQRPHAERGFESATDFSAERWTRSRPTSAGASPATAELLQGRARRGSAGIACIHGLGASRAAVVHLGK